MMTNMGTTKKIGDLGEKMAAKVLVEKGYKIIETNYRYGRSEIDLIAEKEGILVFVEVKTRKNSRFGYPEDFVNEKKAEMIIVAAEHYIMENDWKKDIRFDIVSIIMDKEGHELEHFEDAFF
jgi:putative endonuclease